MSSDQTWRRLVPGAFAVLLGLPVLAQDSPGDEYWDLNTRLPGADAPIWAVALVGNDLYVGGEFVTIGDVVANGIARWDGERWQPLGCGIAGPLAPRVKTAAAQGPNLYAGGYFTSADEVPAANIAKWDVSRWSALGAGIDYQVRALAVRGDDLFVGGSFERAGGVAATNVARWDGRQWHSLGGGLPGEPHDSAVYALAATSEAVYAGGWFSNVVERGVPTSLARWDGEKWSGLGIRSERVDCLHAGEFGLIVGGWLELGPQGAKHRIALWDGAVWKGMSSGLRSAESAFAVSNVRGCFYAAVGGYQDAQTGWASRVLMWDGERWIPLGSGAVPGVNASADAMSSNGTELYAGGIFRIGPAETARTVAVWHIPHTLKVTRDGDALALSWPAPETNAVLEATKSLVSPDWQPVSASPALVNRRLTVTNLPAAGQRFYRLRQP